MLSFKKILEPEYFQNFHCTAGDCEDSCCIGWDVVIDQATYDTYQKCQDAHLKSLLCEHILMNDKSVGDSEYVPYATVKMNHYICPFLTDERLCTIQKTWNEDALSITCDTYPRAFNNVDGVLEQSLYVSCPEAARLILLNTKPMQFNNCESGAEIRNSQIPIVNTKYDAHNKPHRYFGEIRAFIVSLLQDRAYPLWQRLLILSFFCNRLEQVTPKYYDEDIPYLISSFTEKIRAGEYREPMNNAGIDLEMQLQAMKFMIDYRLKGEFISDQFLTCINEFMQGLCFSEGASLDIAVRKGLSH